MDSNSNTQEQPKLDFPLVTIHTSEPKINEETQDVIYFERKSTDKNPVAESEKYRAIVVSKVTLPEAMESTGKDDEVVSAAAPFQRAIREAYFAAAGKLLRTFVESNKEAKEVSTGLFLFSTVVEKMAEEKTSKKLNGQEILAWYDASQTAKDSAARYGDTEDGKKKQAALRGHFAALASNNPGLGKPLALKMTSYVSEKDTEHSVTGWILEKLAVQAKKDTGDDL